MGRYRVLDAGSGHGGVFGDAAFVVALDTSDAALALNERADEKIVADIQTVALEPESFDLIVCNDVLEHLDDPVAAVTNMAAALAPGGTLELGFPDVTSRKSLIAKMTPHWFHVWVYRRIFAFPNAGEPGYGPYVTRLRWSLRPRCMLALARTLGLHVQRLDRERGEVFKGRPLLALLAGRATEYTLVLRKPDRE